MKLASNSTNCANVLNDAEDGTDACAEDSEEEAVVVDILLLYLCKDFTLF